MPSISPIGMPSDEIFGQQVGEHPPDDADRPAGVDDKMEQPQHLVEHEQHRREDQRAEQRHRDRAREIAVDQGRVGGKFGRPSTMIWPQRQPRFHSGRMHPECRGAPSGRGPYSETVRGYMSKVERRADASGPAGSQRRVRPACTARQARAAADRACCPTPNRPATSPSFRASANIAPSIRTSSTMRSSTPARSARR